VRNISDGVQKVGTALCEMSNAAESEEIKKNIIFAIWGFSVDAIKRRGGTWCAD